jgi:uridine phosphorylase
MTWTVGEKKTTYHFDKEASPYLIIDDDLSRIADLTGHCTDIVKVDNQRFDIYQCTYKGKRITVIGTHMTSANTAIIIDQQIDAGAKYIFKLGTFGALQSDIRPGDVYIATGAVRSEGLTDAYAPKYYPAVPDYELVQAVIKHAEGKVPLHFGIIHSVSIYSPYYKQTFNPDKYDPLLYQRLGVCGVEMEVSVTYTIASVKGVKSVAVVVCSRDWRTQEATMQGKPVDWRNEKDAIAKKESHAKVAQIVLDTIADL